jgi:hypothetical protein
MAITYLLKNRDLLASHNVTIEYDPMFPTSLIYGVVLITKTIDFTPSFLVA